MSCNAVLEGALREGRNLLTEVEAKQVVALAGIPAVETHLAPTPQEASSLAERLGFPVALKVASPDIPHKSDVGGVRLGLQGPGEVAQAFEEVTASARRALPSARLLGVTVQPMAPPGVEVILGASRDPQFGPFLMFGLGGVFVEVLRDVAFRLVPLAPRDARQMVREVKGFPLLQGYRGNPPADVPALERALLDLSAFMDSHPLVAELDINPVFVYPRGLLAVDARVLLAGEGG